jgi:hypothetical protein
MPEAICQFGTGSSRETSRHTLDPYRAAGRPAVIGVVHWKLRTSAWRVLYVFCPVTPCLWAWTPSYTLLHPLSSPRVTAIFPTRDRRFSLTPLREKLCHLEQIPDRTTLAKAGPPSPRESAHCESVECEAERHWPSLVVMQQVANHK